jgi:PIN domain nuclease of toxin-antitoxin system
VIIAVADTHTMIWYLGKDSRLPNSVRDFMNESAHNGDLIGVSSMTLIELVYLIEKGRIPPQSFTQLATELRNPDSMFVEVEIGLELVRVFSKVNAQQVPEMPDRIIAATALKFDVPLISRDSKITLSSVKTIW